MKMSIWGDGGRPSPTTKTLTIIGVIILVLVGLRFGLIGGLLGAFLGSIILKKTKTVSSDSAWVKETKSLKIAKYIILGVVVLVAIIFAYFLLQSY